MLGGSASPANLNRKSRGVWNSSDTYLVNDVVSKGNSSYICKATNTNQTPPNATYWDLLVSGDLANATDSVATTTSTTSVTYVVISGMTETPAAGTYFVSFSASGKGSSQSQQMEYSLYNNGSVIDHSERRIDWNSGAQGDQLYGAMHSQAIVTVTGSEAIEARYKTATGTFTVEQRSLLFVRIGE